MQWELIGVEVKDETRPLDVIVVEQVCLKLNDMPALSEKYLVSSSGFTGPAIKKAHAHGLRCLRLRRGVQPVLATIDMSRLQDFTVSTTACLESPAPNVHLEPRQRVAEQHAGASATGAVLLDGSTIDTRELTNRLVTAAVGSLALPEDGDHPFSVHVVIDDPFILRLPSGDVRVTEALVTGVARRTTRVVPTADQFMLEAEDGQPFALALVAYVTGGLFGLMLNESRNLGAFMLPDALRNVRPTRQVLPAGMKVEAKRVDS